MRGSAMLELALALMLVGAIVSAGSGLLGRAVDSHRSREALHAAGMAAAQSALDVSDEQVRRDAVQAAIRVAPSLDPGRVSVQVRGREVRVEIGGRSVLLPRTGPVR
jgi:hypothetical protein